MSFAGAFTALALPPVLLVLLVLLGVLLAWRGWRPGLALAALAAGGELVLASPLAAGMLVASLEREVPAEPAVPEPPPGAIVVLGAEAARTQTGLEVGPLTLERLRAGAALQRRTGLPLLVTGGPLAPGDAPIAVAMAATLRADFGVPVRWVEARARDTRENADYSAALLRDSGIGSAYVVTHGWHLPRALWSFARSGFPAQPAPVRLDRLPSPGYGRWLPRPDALARSWFALREWAGRLVYALRD